MCSLLDKRFLFLIVSHRTTFAKGYYLMPLGLVWLLPMLAISALGAVL